MASSNQGGLWCPECGAEYRSGYAECGDCRVPLGDEPPQPKFRSESDGDHEQVEYDLSQWTDEQRAALTLLLVGRDLPHGWSGSHLIGPRARVAEFDEVVDEIGSAPSINEEIGDPPALEDGADTDPLSGDIASPLRRLGGRVGDMIVLAPFTTFLSAVVLGIHRDSPPGVRLIVIVLAALYEIIPVALWGRTVGKLVARTRVVDLATGAPPSWRGSAVRWVVPSGVGVAASLLSRWGAAATILGMASFICPFVVYAGVVWDRDRQGLHDKAAGTVVVLADTPSRRGWK